MALSMAPLGASAVQAGRVASTGPAAVFAAPVFLGATFTKNRQDAACISIPDLVERAGWQRAHVLCTANGTLMESSDGGLHWATANRIIRQYPNGSFGKTDWLMPTSHTDSRGALHLTGTVESWPHCQLIQGYIQPTAGPWVCQDRFDYSVSNGTIQVELVPQNVTWGPLPRNTSVRSFQGIVHLHGTRSIATGWIWYTNVRQNGGGCCNGTVVCWVTDDGGQTWQFHSQIADKQTLMSFGFLSEEGPTENDIVLLKDGITLLCVIRADGGDGATHHRHAPFLFATSIDGGVSWSLSEAPSNMLSARPRALVLGNGALVVAGGRPGLSLWVSADGYGHTWQQYDLVTEHNKQAAPSQRFCPQFENASLSLTWVQSTAYTQLLPLSDDSALVCYDQISMASSSSPPPLECRVDGQRIFCMRFSVATDTTESLSRELQMLG